MRPIFAGILLFALAACALAPGGGRSIGGAGGQAPPSPVLGQAVETAPLAPPSQRQTPVVPPSVPLVATSAPTPAVTPPPPPPVSAAKQRCEARGGIYAAPPQGGAFACLRRTRDAGKSCDQDRDCAGQCLARSHTCAPFDPLLGCNEVLQDDGYVVNLCLN